ncbi:hypothetical protein KP509_33G048000 [Ceratopteris richardii]|nr:hypothetical protein KP509_33G048000 [Ceratopteris richardii]
MVEVIWSEVGKAKYAEWEKVALPQQQKQKALREFCENALREDYKNSLFRLGSNNKAQSCGALYENIEDEMIDINSSDFLEIDKTTFEVSKLKSSFVEKKQTLDDVFDKAAEYYKPTEVPEFLCCKITMDLYRDPVITPSGITYERAILLDHLEKVGKFDPLTRAPLQAHELITNLAIKEAVKAYLAEHAWAYKTY